MLVDTLRCCSELPRDVSQPVCALFPALDPQPACCLLRVARMASAAPVPMLTASQNQFAEAQ